MTYTLTVDARFEDSARADSTLALVTSDGMALSWGDVFDEYAPALTAFARSRGVREPEDLVQDVFVAAVQQLRDFKGDRSGLRSLLFTIAYRRVADEHRRFYRRREKLVAEHSPSPDPGPTIEQVIGLGESARRALQAFAVLTDRERRVIQMRILEEASPAKVGQTLGLSSGNVRVIQARALAKIRMHLTSTGEKGLTQMMVIGGTLTDFVRYLRAELPPDDVLKPWIEELGANSSPRALEGTALATSATMASSSVAAAERVTEAAYSLFSTVISSGATRIGAVVSVVAMSTLPLAPALLGGAELSSPSDNPLPVVEVQEASPTPLETADEISRDGTEPPVDQPVPDNPVPDNPVPDNPVVDNPVPDNPVPSGSVANNAPPPSDSIRDFDATEGTGPPARERAEVREKTTPDVIDAVVEPLVGDMVESLVDGVAQPPVDDLVEVVEDTGEPLVDDVVEVVEDTGEPLVDDVVEVVEDTGEPLVDDVVEVVEDTGEPLVDDVVEVVEDTGELLVDDLAEPLVEDVTDILEDVVPGLGGLQSGR